MRIGECCRQEELEVERVRNGSLTDLDGVTSSLLLQLLEEDRLKGWIKLLTDVLKKNPLSELNRELERPNKVGL